MNPGSFPPGTTAEDFRKRPHSEPINEVISSVFFKSGLMEAWGCGIPDIFNECKSAGLPAPEFESIPNFVCLTIRFKNPLTPYLANKLSLKQALTLIDVDSFHKYLITEFVLRDATPIRTIKKLKKFLLFKNFRNLHSEMVRKAVLRTLNNYSQQQSQNQQVPSASACV